MKEIIEALRKSVRDAEDNGHRTIEFPTPDAKTLIDFFDKQEPQYSKRFVEHCFKITNKNALDDFYNMWIKHEKDLSCKLISAEKTCKFCGEIITDDHLCTHL
jgi:methionine synthase II (cobalamin-independent)